MLVKDLLEARKHQEKYPKGISALDQLKQLVHQHKDKRLFVSFTEIDKLGVNPLSRYNTPIGIYTYPIEYVLDKELYVPFQRDAKFLQVVTPTETANIIDLGKLTERAATSLIESALLAAEEKGVALGRLKYLRRTYFEDSLQDKKSVGHWWWYSIYDLSREIVSNTYQPVSIVSNAIWRRIGVDGVIDPGLGIIHSNEPTQAVFFSKRAVRLMKTINNTKEDAELKQVWLDVNTHPEQYSPERLMELSYGIGRPLGGRAEQHMLSSLPLAVSYTVHIKKRRWPILEQYLIKEIALKSEWFPLVWSYITKVIKGRWLEVEPFIAQHQTAVSYAQLYMAGHRWSEAEPHILKLKYNYIMSYIRDNVKGRWPEAESILQQYPAAWRWYRDFIARN